MSDPLFWHRVQFGFTIAFHYLFPQLTMGLALLIAVMKGMALRTGQARWSQAARFWAGIFAVNFAVGVVTGIPMEFQFGTNWARFSRFSGGVIGQTLAMEGLFAFFLESSVLGLVLYGQKKLGERNHFYASVLLWLGSWMSGFFIVVTNAFMQHPTGYVMDAKGNLQLSDFWAFVLNPWGLWEYAHTMTASVVTAGFVVAGVGAYWALRGVHAEQSALALRTGVIAALIASCLQVFPTGDQQGKQVAAHQPVSLAAMEGLFESEPGATGLAIIGQPDVAHRRLENPIVVPGLLSVLVYGSFGTTIHGLNDFPQDQWPDHVELLYYAYHVMVGLGTLFIALMALAALLLYRKQLEQYRLVLWALMLATPFPYIATTAGWMVAEMGRQPWLIHGLMRTAVGTSSKVSAGDTLFTLLGFCGVYLVVGLLFLYLVGRAVMRGPLAEEAVHEAPAAAAAATGVA
jgi:cytochrome d ubiquinol oxidase subunit I